MPVETAQENRDGEVARSTLPNPPTSEDPIAKLQHDASREEAVLTLIGEFDEVARNGTKTEPALAFVERYASALTNAYKSGRSTLSAPTRNKLINLLVSFDDARTIPAHALAITHYAETGEGVDEAIWACQAARQLKSEALQTALMDSFKVIDMSDKDGRRYSRHLQAAMAHNATLSWGPVLRERLAPAIERPARFNDKPAVRKFQNQRFWQITAAGLLGDINDRQAARPLLLVLLDSNKRDAHDAARLSLLQLGRPAVEVVLSLLDGSDEGLRAASAKAIESKHAHVYFAADLLRDLAHPMARGALVTRWQASRDPVSRVAIARALAFLPKSEETVALFKKTYNSTPLKLSLPNGESALEALGESLVYFLDTEFVPWLIERIPRVRGAGARKGDVQRMLVMSLSQLVLEHQVEKANRVARKFGGRTGTPAFDQAKQLLENCSNRPDCYLKQLVSAGASGETGEPVALKSVVMVGLLGRAKQRDALLALLPKIKSRVVLVATAHVISYMTPRSSPEVVKALEEITHRDKASRSQHVQRPLEELLYRLRAR